MKKIDLILLLLPLLNYGQIPVTDAATNSQLALLNKNIMALQSQVSSLNGNIAQLIQLMEQNVSATKSSSQSLSQEMASKRTTASFVIAAPEMEQMVQLKEKILASYQATQQSLKAFKNLEQNEKKEAEILLDDSLGTLKGLMEHAKTITSTSDIIEPAARLFQIQNIVKRMEDLLASILEANKRLAQKNEHRKALQTVTTIN